MTIGLLLLRLLVGGVLGMAVLALTSTGPGRSSVSYALGVDLAGAGWAVGAALLALVATFSVRLLTRSHPTRPGAQR